MEWESCPRNQLSIGSTISTNDNDEDALKIEIGGDVVTNRKKTRKPYNRIKTTKYTLLSFIPLNLYEQFRRLAYFYYLVVTIISFFVNSTISPMTSLIPLLFVILVSGIKSAREEFLRWRTDRVVNRCPVTVIRDGVRMSIASEFIAPGDLVVVERDCDVPCDMVLLETTDPHNKCYVTTANLDGETNLKTLSLPRNLPETVVENLDKLGHIECETAKTDLYSFNGKIILSEKYGKETSVLSLNTDNLLLRGARVKNTECVIGCAIYTGMTTKLQLNSRLSSNKAASSDNYINRYLLFLVVVMVIFVTILYMLERQDELFTIPDMFYLGEPIDVNKITTILEDYLSFLVIVNYMVPVSMYMNIELYRVFGALFLMWDLKLYDEETDQPCVVNTSNLNEELGQINFMFSDKTGTLTKNEMVFQQCSINGEIFAFKEQRLVTKETTEVRDLNNFNQQQITFFEALTICHTVQVIRVTEEDDQIDNVSQKRAKDEVIRFGYSNDQLNEYFGDVQRTKADFRRSISMLESSENLHVISHLRRTQSMRASSDSLEEPRIRVQRKMSRTPSIASQESYAAPVYQRPFESQSFFEYQASSSDEKALIEACSCLGFKFLGDDGEFLHLEEDHGASGKKEIRFERLHILEFTPERKRMSVIVRDEEKKIWIYTKGAESCILPLCNQENIDLIKKTDEDITEFAKHGLRTLAVARRQILDEEYADFLEALTEANNSLDCRKELSEECYAKVEKNFQLLGATAVEDKLQDDVASTLESLQQAGMKIWVLTGDKVETALNIALACGHIPPNAFHILILNCTSADALLGKLTELERHLNSGDTCALLIDGVSLATVFEHTSIEFRDIAIRCQAVLGCRLSPLQKSEVIALVKGASSKFITAAVGDGANDVSMIQEAHVGIGIMGKEGRQAARSADYAVSKFSMLKRLFLVHGHYNSSRLSFLVLFYCYKNVVITGNMFLYQFHTLFSSTSVYHSLFLWLYDVIYISAGLTCVTLTEKPYPEEQILSEPKLYLKNANNKQARWSIFLLWMLNGLYQTLVIYFFGYLTIGESDILWHDGDTADFYCFGTILVQVVIIVENFKLLFSAKFLSYWLYGLVYASLAAFALSTYLYNIIDDSTGLYKTYNYLLASAPMWFYTILTTVTCLMPEYFHQGLKDLKKIKNPSMKY